MIQPITLVSRGFSLPPNIPKVGHARFDGLDAWHSYALLKSIRDFLRPDLAADSVCGPTSYSLAFKVIEAQAEADGVKCPFGMHYAFRKISSAWWARETLAAWIGVPGDEIWPFHNFSALLILSDQPAWSERAAAKAVALPAASPTPVAEPAAPFRGDSEASTLERAFATASLAARSTMGRAVDDAVMAGAIRRTQALLGQLLAEEAATTPWDRWKTASCELVNWWAARFMSALYIAPKRKHPQKVQLSSHQNETGKACPTFGGQP